MRVLPAEAKAKAVMGQKSSLDLPWEVETVVFEVALAGDSSSEGSEVCGASHRVLQLLQLLVWWRGDRQLKQTLELLTKPFLLS